ncbi:MAG TPA: prepilin peptidase [Opitutaceae bacterium]|jgi:leader peptidase (prepilin peptidase)/N-methyltransferase
MRLLGEVAAIHPWFFPAIAFVLGACIGSFLNVVIYRVPAGKSIVTPGSTCACGKAIAWHDNIPILSWLVLRGRARCCGRRFSFRYPFVELLTACLFLACWLRLPPAVAVCGWVLLSSLVCATFIDLDHMIIPDVFTIGLAVAGLLLSALVPALHGERSAFYILDSLRSGADAMAGLIAGSGVILWIALISEAILKKEAMGFGDVKFVGAIGAFCGWHGAVFAIFGGAAVGTLWIALALAWQKVSGRPGAGAPRAETPEGEPAEMGLGVHVPFGPMLAVAGAIYFLFLRGPVDAWFGQVNALL